MRLFHVKLAGVALGAVLAVTGQARAQQADTVLLGGAKPTANPTADTMTLGGLGTLQSARESDSELARGYARGGWGRGGWGGGVRVGVGYRGGWGRGGWGHGGWGRGWGGVRIGIGIGWGGYRGWGYGYRGWGGYGYGYRPYYVASYGYPVYSYGYGGYCGISANTVDLNAPAVPLNAMAQASPVPVIRIPSTIPPMTPATENRTFPYDGGPKQVVPPPIPQPLDTPKPSADGSIPPASDVRVVLKASDFKGLVKPNPSYVFKAYGEK